MLLGTAKCGLKIERNPRAWIAETWPWNTSKGTKLKQGSLLNHTTKPPNHQLRGSEGMGLFSDPYIIHLNIATCKWWFPFLLVMKKPCFKWLQNGDLLRSPVTEHGRGCERLIAEKAVTRAKCTLPPFSHGESGRDPFPFNRNMVARITSANIERLHVNWEAKAARFMSLRWLVHHLLTGSQAFLG